MARRALLLMNRQARCGADDDGIADTLRSLGFELVEESIATPDHFTELIRAHRDRVELVIVGGGDGSMNAAAAGLIETGLPLGILPRGTANDLARTLDLPLDPADACAVIANGKTRRIDLGQANDKYYFNVASMGLSVQITKQLDKETKRIWGALAYALTALRVIATSRPFVAQIRSSDGTAEVRTLQIAVGNGRYYGGGMAVADDAAIDDQRLNLYSLECRRWWRLLMLAPLIWLGKHGHGHDVRALSGREFEIRTRRPLPVSADGEIVTQTPVTFRVLPAAVTVFAPEESRQKSVR